MHTLLSFKKGILPSTIPIPPHPIHSTPPLPSLHKTFSQSEDSIGALIKRRRTTVAAFSSVKLHLERKLDYVRRRTAVLSLGHFFCDWLVWPLVVSAGASVSAKGFISSSFRHVRPKSVHFIFLKTKKEEKMSP